MYGHLDTFKIFCLITKNFYFEKPYQGKGSHHIIKFYYMYCFSSVNL